MASTTDAHRDDHAGIDTNDPEFWGWHHTFGKAARVAGIVVALVILSMSIGNHTGNVENLWLALVAVIMLAGIAYDASKRRKAWRR